MPKSPTDWLKMLARSRGANSDDAEDIAQEATLRMCRHLRQGGVVNDRRAFLGRVTSNLVTDLYRANAVRGEEVSLENVCIVDSAPTPDEQYGAEQLMRRVSELLEDRDPKICAAFWLHRLYGKNHSEIARMLSVSVSSVEKYIAAAMATLTVERHELEQQR